MPDARRVSRVYVPVRAVRRRFGIAPLTTRRRLTDGCPMKGSPIAVLFSLRNTVQLQTKAMAKRRKLIDAIAYLRTSSATNSGPGKRQRATIAAFAKTHGYSIVAEFYDAAISGADPIAERPGFQAMLDRISGNGIRCIILESPDRFARDLTVQLIGHDFLKKLGIALVPATAPDFFTEDTPTAVLVRQVLGAIAEFEKTSLVAKLKVARDRKRAETGKCGGRKSYAEAKPETVALAKELHGRHMSLRRISSELGTRGHLTARGKRYVASAVQRMLVL